MMFNKDEIIKLNQELSGLKREFIKLKEFDFHDIERISNLMSMYDSVQSTNYELSREISELKKQLNQLHAKNSNAHILNCSFSGISKLGNNNYVLVTRKKPFGKYKYIKLPFCVLSHSLTSEFYQLKDLNDATVFESKRQANHFNPDPELFEAVPETH